VLDTNTLIIGTFATLAQHEPELISSRTKAALRPKLDQGATLGNPDNLHFRRKLRAWWATKRGQRPTKTIGALSLTSTLYKSGSNYSQIATQLNGACFKASRGGGFQATQVMPLIKRQE
jgi:DNA invertase Pin-like site-specific DNA recombinase